MQIIHGENEIGSRNLLLSLKKQATQAGRQVIELRGASVTLADLISSSSAVSLFGPENLLFMDSFFSRRPGAEKSQIIEYLTQHTDIDMVIWESQDVSTAVKSFPTSVIRKFDLPKYLFQFVDSWTLAGFHQALSSAAPEQILVLLAKRIHDLILVKSGAGSFPAWQLTKLKSQANHHTLERLSIYNTELLRIDYAQKNSLSSSDLAGALEIWLISHNW